MREQTLKEMRDGLSERPLEEMSEHELMLFEGRLMRIEYAKRIREFMNDLEN